VRVREGEAAGGRQVAAGGGGHQDCADRVTAKQKEEEAKESGQDPNCRVRQRTPNGTHLPRPQRGRKHTARART